MFLNASKPYTDFKDNYEVRRNIGKGKFSAVYLVVNKVQQSSAAAKFISITRGKTQEDYVRNEVEILKSVQHKNIVEYVDSYSAKPGVVIVTNYYAGGELYQRIKKEHPGEQEILIYVRQICEALEYLHNKNIVHRDIKPNNIVCQDVDSKHIRLVDFGLACYLDGHYDTRTCGTRAFMAPEVVRSEPVSGAVDMWSLGVTTYWLLSQSLPFPDTPDQCDKILNGGYTYSENLFKNVSSDAKNFIDCLLFLEPEHRLTSSLALQHVWLRDSQNPKVDM